MTTASMVFSVDGVDPGHVDIREPARGAGRTSGRTPPCHLGWLRDDTRGHQVRPLAPLQLLE